MSAVVALRVARAAGVELALDGNDLSLKAASEPPATVLDALQRHKTEIVAMLRSERDGWSAEDWRLYFEERAAIAEFDGGLPRAKADGRCHVAGSESGSVCAWPLRLVRAVRKSRPSRAVWNGAGNPPAPRVLVGVAENASISGEGSSDSNGYPQCFRWRHRSW